MSDEEKLNAIRESFPEYVPYYENGTVNIFAFYRTRILRYKKFIAFKEAVKQDLIVTKGRAKEGYGFPTPTIQEVEDLETLFFLVKKFD